MFFLTKTVYSTVFSRQNGLRLMEMSMRRVSKVTMTKTKYGTPCVQVNGRQYFLFHLTSIEKGKDDYAWIVTHQNGEVFEVWGGKASGGGARQWYVEWPNGGNAKCTSLVDGLKLLDGM